MCYYDNSMMIGSFFQWTMLKLSLVQSVQVWESTAGCSASASTMEIRSIQGGTEISNTTQEWFLQIRTQHWPRLVGKTYSNRQKKLFFSRTWEKFIKFTHFLVYVCVAFKQQWFVPLIFWLHLPFLVSGSWFQPPKHPFSPSNSHSQPPPPICSTSASYFSSTYARLVNFIHVTCSAPY